jgi:hypothetical protein
VWSLKTELCEKDRKALFKAAVEIINLETSYQCNRKCDYCPVSNSTRQTVQSYMSLDLIEKISIQLAEIRYEKEISLNLYNEPLLDEELEKKVKIIRGHLPWATLTLNSNGDKLQEARLKQLSNAGLNHICVTLHPQPYKSDSSSVLSRRIKKMIEKNAEDRKLLFNLNDGCVEFDTHGLKVRIQWPDWRINGTDRGGQIQNYGSGKVKRTAPCVKPFREFTVFYDGEVQPCCESFHDNDKLLLIIANLNHTSIFDAYASSKLAAFRRSVFNFGAKSGICEFCTSVDYSNRDTDGALREEILRSVK